jgi:hypothetical protein
MKGSRVRRRDRIPAFDNSDQCLFGGGTVNIEYWADQACKGSGGFALPAPRRAWFLRGKGRIEKTASCQGTHDEPSNERREIASGLGTIVLEWFPPDRLEEHIKRLKKAHGNAIPLRDIPGIRGRELGERTLRQGELCRFLAGRAARNFDADPVRIKHELLVVALEVSVLLGQMVDPRPDPEAALVGGVDLLWAPRRLRARVRGTDRRNGGRQPLPSRGTSDSAPTRAGRGVPAQRGRRQALVRRR